MVKKSLSLIYRIALWLISFIAIVVLLAALIIQFYVFPNIDQYKNKIADYASKEAKQKVVIGNIKAGWQNFDPHLSIANIDIYDAQNRPALQLKNTDASFSWLSIPLLEPRLASFTIRAPELTIRRDAKGDIFVAGMSTEGQSKPDLANWLLRQSKFEVLNAKVIWLDEMRNAPALSLDKLNLQVSSPPWKSLLKNHRITVSALPSIGTSEPIVVNADVYGNDVSQIAQWSGSVEAQLKNADIAAFKPWVDYTRFTQPINVQSGIGSANVKVQFAKQQVQSITSKVTLNNVQIQLKSNAEPMLLNTLAGDLSWKNTKSAQTFNVEHLTLNTGNGLNLQEASGSYVEDLKGEKSLNVQLAHVDLASVKPYLVQLPLPADTLQKIIGLSPAGKLDGLTMQWKGNATTTKTYLLNTKFNGLGIGSHEKIPGFSNLTGEIKANQNNGKITLNSKNVALDFKTILRWPIPADTLDGDIAWEISDKATKIHTDNLSISSPHLAGMVNASYLIDGNKGGLLDLKGKFGKANAKFATFYYPTMLGKTTLHWLDTSILAGRAEDINLIVKGRLADFPYVNSQNKLDSKLGLFRVTAKVSDSLLEYGADWPVIEGLGLDLLFEGKRMELNANAGHIFGNQIIKSKTTIAQLDADSPMLIIDSELQGSVEEGIKFVNKSPVREVTQGFTEDLKTSGQGKLALGLIIPMQNLEAAKYKGAYQIIDGSMAAQSIPILTRINGLLEFTESNLTAKNINAMAFGSPAVISLNTGKDISNNQTKILVTAKGKMNDAGIKQMLLEQGADNVSLAKAANYLTGSADWLADITIQKPVVNIDIRSDLVGLSSTLPIPFNKSASERLNLRIIKKQEPSKDTISVNLGNKLAAKIARAGDNEKLLFDRGSIRFNTGAPAANSSELNSNLELGNAKGLQVYGNVDYLNVDAWRTVLLELTDAKSANKTSQEPTLPIQKIALKINTLDIFDRRINQLKISHSADKDGLRANIQSREITGDVQWISENNGKLIARLSNLTVPEAAPNNASANTQESNQTSFKKLEQDYPILDITADNFSFNKKNFGALALIAYPQNDNWNIEKLKLTTADSVINAEGQWNNWVKNPNTYLNITWDIKNLGKTLNGIGYPDTIKGGAGTLTGQLQWPGSPHEFNPTGLNGDFQLNLKKGQILKVQPGVGRLLGLLSLQSLPRRLTLDFRDLFSNGFAFDKISGAAKVERGVMRSDNFEMSGPAADVLIKGETNLQKETQHLTVKVMPHVSDSLSLAALAGGPLAGAIAFLAQKILRDPLNKIASSEYEIVGTWDNPQEVNAEKSNADANKKSILNQ
ncbi:MAG: TIGR02099 family protein [Methylotenera sp.]|nr:TIGR02099 family protein [Methylotenera sp.]